YILNYSIGIRSFQHHNNTSNSFLTILCKSSVTYLAAKTYLFSYICNGNRDSVSVYDNYFSNVIQGLDQAFSPYEIGHSVFFNVCTTGINIVLIQGIIYLGDAYILSI